MKEMTLATLNMWNDDNQRQERFLSLVDEVKKLSPDLLALQEVPAFLDESTPVTEAMRDELPEYNFCFHPYSQSPSFNNRSEGLALLYKGELLKSTPLWDENKNNRNNWLVSYQLRINDSEVRLTNLHLDWESAAARVEVLKEHLSKDDLNQNFIVGDFNDYREKGLVHPALEDRFVDFCTASGEGPKTLDFSTNPRWSKSPSDEKNGRFDRIYYPKASSSDNIRYISIDNDGKIVIAGTGKDGSNFNGIVCRLTTAGALDVTFAGDGCFTIDGIGGTTGKTDYLNDIAINSSNEVFVVGYSYNASNDSVGTLLKLKNDGTLDTSFATNGIYNYSVSSDADGSNDSFSTIVLDSLEKIYVGGRKDDSSLILKLTSTGTLDQSFGTNGVLTWGTTGWSGDQVYALAFTADGSLLATGVGADGGSDTLLFVSRVY
jgi:maltose 6'-phosphate phosphatase